MSAGTVLAGLLMGLGGGTGGGTWWEKRRQRRQAVAEVGAAENKFWEAYDEAAYRLRQASWAEALWWVTVMARTLGEATSARNAAWPVYDASGERLGKMNVALTRMAEHLTARTAPPALVETIPSTAPRPNLGGLAP